MKTIKSPWDWIYIINFKTYEGQEISTENKFVPYIINQHFAQFSDTIFISQQLNEMNALPLEMQFWFLYGSISKRKRFSKWIKKDLPKELDAVMSYYDCNHQRAEEYIERLTPDELSIILNTIEQDGA
jgi:hypothetical protein